jgi:GNAT superfamily N-acetyltransferase
MYIRAEFQRRGVGTKLVERLMREARDANLPIGLRVLRVKPARAFYERWVRGD